jgi:hypothetical protein
MGGGDYKGATALNPWTAIAEVKSRIGPWDITSQPGRILAASSGDCQNRLTSIFSLPRAAGLLTIDGRQAEPLSPVKENER